MEKEVRQNSRLREIMDVLSKYKVLRGLTPEKLRCVLEELGPTFVKLGQIMSLHSDILPEAYCNELMKLNSEVAPMEFSVVKNELETAYGTVWDEVFENIEEKPIGSASIAQVHRARLVTGEEVIVKVQRKGIYDIMARDIRLMKRGAKLLPPVGQIGDIKNVVDIDMVLDELWSVAQEEMDFLKEARNMEEFAANSQGIAYVRVPKLYREYTTRRVLVMEYIGGCAINDKKQLLAEGYDLEEVGGKLVNHFIKQVMEDGFFHADPHPGNVKVLDGKIVWIDMGMMGRLTSRDRAIMEKGVRGIAAKDVSVVEDAVRELGEFRGRPDEGRLYKDLKGFLEKYGSASMGDIDIAKTMRELLEIMKRNNITVPHGMTMLVRGLTHMEGVLAEISPDINMFQIAAVRVRDDYLEHLDWKNESRRFLRHLIRNAKRADEIPVLATDMMKEYLNGQSKTNLDLRIPKETSDLFRRLVRNIVMGLWVMALLIGSSILCTTDMQPKVLGIPLIGFFGYMMAFVICLYIFIRHFLTRNK